MRVVVVRSELLLPADPAPDELVPVELVPVEPVPVPAVPCALAAGAKAKAPQSVARVMM